MLSQVSSVGSQKVLSTQHEDKDRDRDRDRERDRERDKEAKGRTQRSASEDEAGTSAYPPFSPAALTDKTASGSADRDRGDHLSRSSSSDVETRASPVNLSGVPLNHQSAIAALNGDSHALTSPGSDNVQQQLQHVDWPSPLNLSDRPPPMEEAESPSISPTFRLVPLRRAVNSASSFPSGEKDKLSDRVDREVRGGMIISKVKSNDLAYRPNTVQGFDRKSDKEFFGDADRLTSMTPDLISVGPNAVRMANLALVSDRAGGESSVLTSREARERDKEKEREREGLPSARRKYSAGNASAAAFGSGLVIAPSKYEQAMSTVLTIGSSSPSSNNDRRKAKQSPLYLAGTSSLRSHRASSAVVSSGQSTPVTPSSVKSPSADREVKGVANSGASKGIAEDDVTESGTSKLTSSRNRGGSNSTLLSGSSPLLVRKPKVPKMRTQNYIENNVFERKENAAAEDKINRSGGASLDSGEGK